MASETSSVGAFYGKGFVRCPAAATLCNAEKVSALSLIALPKRRCIVRSNSGRRRVHIIILAFFLSLFLSHSHDLPPFLLLTRRHLQLCNSEQFTAAFAAASPGFDRRCPAPRDLLLATASMTSATLGASWGALECGGVARGACTGEARVCTCAYGFAGRACEQTRCIDGCNGHGTCDILSGTCSCAATHDGPSCAAETAIGWITARPLVTIVLLGGALCACVACICCCVWAAAVACHIFKKRKVAEGDGKHAAEGGDDGIAMTSANQRASTGNSRVEGGGGHRRHTEVEVRRSAAVPARVGERVFV